MNYDISTYVTKRKSSRLNLITRQALKSIFKKKIKRQIVLLFKIMFSAFMSEILKNFHHEIEIIKKNIE